VHATMMRLPVFLLLGLIVLGLSSCRSVRPEPEAPPLPTPEPPPETRPVERTMQGFKIQVFSTTDRDDAGAKEAEVLEWWQSLSPNQRPQGLQSDRNLVDVHWRSPYYRIRVGNFVTREEAERARTLLLRDFPEAFVVPDTVTVIR
jgi:hypothetical protein